jgi:hypothetical protein
MELPLIIIIQCQVFKDGTTGVPQNINWVDMDMMDGNQSSPLSLARYWLYKFQNGTECQLDTFYRNDD